MAGFSADSTHYIYLESSRDTGAGIPLVDLQIVNLASNQCVQNGCVSTDYGEAQAGRTLLSAENDLLRQTFLLRQQLRLTPPIPGIPLPIVARSRTPDNTEFVTVRLGNQRNIQRNIQRNTQQFLRLQLQQRHDAAHAKGNPGRDRSAMQLQITYNDQNHTLDSLDNLRDGVLRYSIRDVYLSPDRRNLVVLVSMIKPTFEGQLETTLVQGVDLF
jgi:predicted secreted protein